MSYTLKNQLCVQFHNVRFDFVTVKVIDKFDIDSNNRES